MSKLIHDSKIRRLLAAALLALAACASDNSAVGAKAAAPGGAELWSRSCVRCHNNRSPANYSDAEWSVAMRHMRVRANLTAQEERIILEFLQSAN